MNTWYIALVGLVIFLVRAAMRKTSSREVCCFLWLLVSVVMIQGMMWFSEHSSVIDPRYHIPSVVLLFPFCGYLLARISAGRKMVLLFLLAGFCFIQYRFAHNARKFARPDKPSGVLVAVGEWVRGVIDRDWEGSRRFHSYSAVDYRPPLAPEIGGFPYFAYRAGGRLAKASFFAALPKSQDAWPDYVVSLDSSGFWTSPQSGTHQLPRFCCPVAQCSFGAVTGTVYRCTARPPKP